LRWDYFIFFLVVWPLAYYAGYFACWRKRQRLSYADILNVRILLRHSSPDELDEFTVKRMRELDKTNRWW
jgi:hypothetical protein